MAKEIQLTIPEVQSIYMGLDMVIENMDIATKDIVFNKEAKFLVDDLLKTAKSAISKISLATGVPHSSIPPYKDGDEKEFINNPNNEN